MIKLGRRSDNEVILFSLCSHIESSARFKVFLNSVVKLGPVGQLYAQVKAERDAYGNEKTE